MRKCLICKKPFNPKRSHAKTCGTACRSMLYRLEHAANKARKLPPQSAGHSGERQPDGDPLPKQAAPRVRRVDFERQLLTQAPPNAVRYRLLIDQEESVENLVMSVKETMANLALAHGETNRKKLRELAQRATPGRSPSLSLIPFESPANIELQAGRHYRIIWEAEDTSVIPTPPLMGSAHLYYFNGPPDPVGPEDEGVDRVIRTNIALREELTRVRDQARELLRKKKELRKRSDDLNQELQEARDDAEASLQKAKSEFHYQEFFWGMGLSAGAIGAQHMEWADIIKNLQEKFGPSLRAALETLQNKQAQGADAVEETGSSTTRTPASEPEVPAETATIPKSDEPGMLLGAVFTARMLRNDPFQEAEFRRMQTLPIDGMRHSMRQEILSAAQRSQPQTETSKQRPENVWRNARRLLIGVNRLNAELLERIDNGIALAPKGLLDRPVQELTLIWQVHEHSFPRSNPKPEQLQSVRNLLEGLDDWLGKEAAQAQNSAGSKLLFVSVFEARDAVNAALRALA